MGHGRDIGFVVSFFLLGKISPELTSVASLPPLYKWVTTTAWFTSGVGLCPGSKPMNLGRQSGACPT